MVDEELLQSMYNHGCYGIIYGAESVDQNILNFMNKGITVDQIENAINISRKANIKVMLNFIFGMPGETISNIKNTIEFAKNIKPESIGFQIATPIPGTKLYDYCVENDLLLTKDWDLYNLTNQIIKLDNIKNGQIEHYRSLALSLLMNNNYTNNDENEYLFHIL
jgi:magnesium-protoporphyrin IX monomethyl ester (oxidative) cyclase